MSGLSSRRRMRNPEGFSMRPLPYGTTFSNRPGRWTGMGIAVGGASDSEHEKMLRIFELQLEGARAPTGWELRANASLRRPPVFDRVSPGVAIGRLGPQDPRMPAGSEKPRGRPRTSLPEGDAPPSGSEFRDDLFNKTGETGKRSRSCPASGAQRRMAQFL